MYYHKIISFHPKLAAGLDFLFSLVMVWWILKISNPYLLLAWFLFRTVWWAALVQCVYYPPFVSRYWHLANLVFFNLGLTAFFVFVDSRLTIGLLKLIFMLLPALTFWLIPDKAGALSVMAKPQRRARFLLSATGLMGCGAGAAALIVFQIVSGWQSILLMFALTVVIMAVSGRWWREYDLPLNNNFRLALLALGLIIGELSYIIAFWPLGYLVSGFLLTWWWYLIWIFFRFSQTAAGINWKKQKWFIIFNILLMIVFLTLIVRWK